LSFIQKRLVTYSQSAHHSVVTTARGSSTSLDKNSL